VICIVQEVILKLGSVHVVIRFQHDAFERLVYINTVGVVKFVMYANELHLDECY
jgi:hypothetical protein